MWFHCVSTHTFDLSRIYIRFKHVSIIYEAYFRWQCIKHQQQERSVLTLAWNGSSLLIFGVLQSSQSLNELLICLELSHFVFYKYFVYDHVVISFLNQRFPFSYSYNLPLNLWILNVDDDYFKENKDGSPQGDHEKQDKRTLVFQASINSTSRYVRHVTLNSNIIPLNHSISTTKK